MSPLQVESTLAVYDYPSVAKSYKNVPFASVGNELHFVRQTIATASSDPNSQEAGVAFSAHQRLDLVGSIFRKSNQTLVASSHPFRQIFFRLHFHYAGTISTAEPKSS